MKAPVVHDTVVVERVYEAPRDLVFQAWADVDQRRRWHFPGDGDWVLVHMSQDFQVGGVERIEFGPSKAPNLMSEGRFLDIVENARIVSAGSMHEDGQRIAATLCTVELSDPAGGTRVKLTDQSAFFDGREMPQQRRSGWGRIFERLGAVLSSPSRTLGEGGGR